MGIEIERKFLVRDETWRAAADRGRHFCQFYIALREDLSVRLRTVDDSAAFLTVKTGTGLLRGEYEYAVPPADALALEGSRVGEILAKRRFRVPLGALTVEVDVFEGALAPLVLAEIELPSAEHAVDLPAFLGREVTGDPAYGNSRLARDGLPPRFRA